MLRIPSCDVVLMCTCTCNENLTGNKGMAGNGLVANSQRYYGSELQTSSDLKTSACTSSCAPPKAIRPILKQIPPEVKDKFYGPLPPQHSLSFFSFSSKR
jgi:hypothetical protein